MTIRPLTSRRQLTAQRFSQNDGGDWELELPAYYVRLFETTFPRIRSKAVEGFRILRGESQIARLRELTIREIELIQKFITWYQRSICISTNKHLDGVFFDELDFCLALDKNYPEPGQERTEIGEWEYQAKYKHDDAAAKKLASEMVRAIRSVQSFANAPRLLSYVPSSSSNKFYLPAEIASLVLADPSVARLLTTEGELLLVPTLTVDKQEAKSMKVSEKIVQWQNLIAEDRIRLSRDIRGHSVIVLDDLYQSGATLWSYAKFLKSHHAVSVIGLVCVKSLRDSDNRSDAPVGSTP